VPDGWTSSGNWRAHAHAVALSNEPSPVGGRTVCIARASAPWRWGEGSLVQTFSAEPWRGKRLRFGGAVRTNVQGMGAGAQLYVEVRLRPREGVTWQMPASGVAMIGRPVQSPQWETHTIEIDIPETAHSIAIGMVLSGNGAAYFGDLELESG
jgi:hypothetical protein